jgi:SAM-dependent methyltransferase
MFDVTADAYARFMGRYADLLATEFVELLSLREGQRALDVGCGPGALTARLVERLGPDAVAAVDPSYTFVSAVAQRFPGLDVQQARAEALPYPDASFDAAAAQLVVHFMRDPVAGLREMARVVRPGGVLAACVWDHAGRAGPLTTFWEAVHALDADAPGEAGLAGAREGHLGELCRSAGLTGVEAEALTVRVRFDTFAEWWDPFTLGVGPAGAYVAALAETAREELREECRRRLPVAPFEIAATAWCARAAV